jgi:AraC-like DNA-binding protein
VLVLGFLLVRIDAIIVTLGYIISIQFGFEVNYKMLGLMSNWTVLLLISFLIFFSIGFSNIFQGISSSKEKESEKQPISMETVKLIQQYMVDRKPYLNHLLTIDNLANQLNIAPRTLSQIINRHFLQNFFEFINQYRIDESKILLVSEEHKKSTMLEVMDLAGFNSKATFNTFFKKIVGLTPTQYRKQQLQS